MKNRWIVMILVVPVCLVGLTAVLWMTTRSATAVSTAPLGDLDQFVYLPLLQSAEATPTATPTPQPSSVTEQVVALVNEERAAAGCDPVTRNDRLQTAAQLHSEDMAVNDFFDHDGSNGSKFFERIEAQSYRYSRAGENIAAGRSTAEGVMNQWMNSSGHRANILDCRFTEIGVGYVNMNPDTGTTNYRHYWTQVFARPR